MRKSTVEARRIEILETTCQVVIERGFAATRVADVANKLGVSVDAISKRVQELESLFSGAGWNLGGRNPRLAVINNKVYCAWVESRPGDYAMTGYNVIVVKHLDAGQWIQDGPEFNVGTTAGSRIVDLAMSTQPVRDLADGFCGHVESGTIGDHVGS